MSCLTEEKVFYRSGEVQLCGVLIYEPGEHSIRPGVVMAPNMMGPTESNIAQAAKIAREGYVVLVADLYGRLPGSSEEASDAMKSIKDSPEERYRMRAALQFLSEHSRVDESRMAAVGFCYGGHCVLELARAGLPLKAAFCVHGTLNTRSPAVKGGISAKVVVLNGAGDPFVDPRQIGDFCNEMAHAEADFMFVNYAGAVHSFTYPKADVPGKMEYNERVSNKAFVTIYEVLNDVFN